MKDLNCVSPEIFNIRHTERGVRTRNTKRKGGNIHCIMAFKKVQESISFTSFNSVDATGGTDHVDSAETVSLSEVEDLDSSDSDFPDSEKPEDQSKNAPNLSIDFDKIEIPDIKMITSPSDEGKVIAQSVEPEILAEPVGSGLRRSGTFTKEAPTIRVEVRRLPSTESESSVDSTANLDGSATNPEYLAANPEHFDNTTTPHLLVAGGGEEVKGDSSSPTVRRSGTFTKDAPTVRVQKTRLSSSEYDSDSDSNLEPVDYSFDGNGLGRSLTFTKRSTTVAQYSGNDTDTSDDELQRSETFNKENMDNGLGQSKTFIKDDDSLYPQGGDDSETPVSGMKRSGTFTITRSNEDSDNLDMKAGVSSDSEESDDEKIAKSGHLPTEAETSLVMGIRENIDLDETLKASDFLNKSDHSL